MAEPDRRRADWAASALKTLAALALGGVGGWVFYSLRMPLPWMLGSLSFTMVAALLGAKLHGPPALRNGLIALLGIMIGSGFTASMLLQAGEWLISLAAILLVIFIAPLFFHLLPRGMLAAAPADD
jgi:uncharacterized membrane protein AbrB (regulator of aidB expression)